MRSELLPHMSDCLRGLAVSPSWLINARPCSPRVLFIFEKNNVDKLNNLSERDIKTRKIPPIKKLQHSIEDQIYRILRKSRIITNISNNSLFAIPANQEFVYIQNAAWQSSSDFYLSHLTTATTQADDANANAKGKGYQANRRGTESRPRAQSSSSQAKVNVNHEPGSLQAFLWQHIELAHSKGFDDNVGRNPLPAHFELPKASTWLEVCQRMYDFFMVNQDGQARQYFNTLRSLLEIDSRFSESRCSKVLPQAERAYQDGLPAHYTEQYHLDKLSEACEVFKQHARGPAQEKYLAQLETHCEKHWHQGRQMCEQRSCTGSPCIKQLHDIVERVDSQLPTMPHSSQISMKSACNCGRTQTDRDDPFCHKEANYTFYELASAGCCNKLPEKITLPVFQPSSTEFHACRLPGTTPPKLTVVGRLKETTKLPELAHTMSGLSLALSLGNTDSGNTGTDIYHQQDHLSQSDNSNSQHRHLGQSDQDDSESEGSHSLDSRNEDQSERSTQDSADQSDQSSQEEDDHSDLSSDEMSNQLEKASPATAHLDKTINESVESLKKSTEESTEQPVKQTDESGNRLKHTSGDATSVSNSKDDVSDVPAGGSDVRPPGTVAADDSAIVTAGHMTMLVQQHSTTEYLPEMVHTDSPLGLLPEFPSWSIVSLGKYNTYSSQTGLDQPGFLHGSNFLLPWDIAVRGGSVDKSKWPLVSEATGKKLPKYRKGHRDQGEVTVRIYLGNEYECPRGHRFFCSGPEKMLKVPPSGPFKENAHRLVNLDMPLYYPCHCRSTSGYFAQLMRCYISLPAGPLEIQLNPRVVPAAPPCPVYFPGNQGPISLHGGELWVLRLPYVYMGEDGPLLPPSDPAQLHHCKIMKGLYNFVQVQV